MSEQDEAKFRENLSEIRANRLRNDSELSHFEETADQHIATSWSASEHLETINETSRRPVPSVPNRSQETIQRPHRIEQTSVRPEFHNELGAKIKIKQSKSGSSERLTVPKYREKGASRWTNGRAVVYNEPSIISDNSRQNRRNYNTFSNHNSNTRSNSERQPLLGDQFYQTESQISGKH